MPVIDPSTALPESRVMSHYTLIILAGGAGRRMGGADKGLLPWHGQPVAQHLLQRFNDAAQHLLVVNRHLAEYRALAAPFGAQVLQDHSEALLGPLAGLQAALPAARCAQCVLLPCDMPRLPATLPRQLCAARLDTADIAVLHDGQRLQPLCMALDSGYWQQNLDSWLNDRDRSVHGWLRDKPIRPVQCNEAARDAFANLNYPDEWTSG